METLARLLKKSAKKIVFKPICAKSYFQFLYLSVNLICHLNNFSCTMYSRANLQNSSRVSIYSPCKVLRTRLLLPGTSLNRRRIR